MDSDESILRVDTENQWIVEEIKSIVESRYPKFEGAQWVGTSSDDEPDRVSFFTILKGEVMFLEFFYEIIGDKMLRINKVKDLNTEEEMMWQEEVD